MGLTYGLHTYNLVTIGLELLTTMLIEYFSKISLSTTMVQNRIPSFQFIRRKGMALFLTRCHLSINEYIYNTVQCDDFEKSKFYTTFTALHF